METLCSFLIETVTGNHRTEKRCYCPCSPYKLDGSEEEIEAKIADAHVGLRIFPSGRSFMVVVAKF